MPLANLRRNDECVVEFAPTRAWVNGKQDARALASAEPQVFIVKSDHGQLEQLKDENEQLREEAETLSLRVQYEAHRGQIVALQERLAAEAQGKAEWGKAEQRVRMAENALSEARAENAQLAARLHDVGAEMNSLRLKWGEELATSTKVRQLEATLRAAQERVAASDAAAGGAASELASLRDELSRVKALAHEAVRNFHEQARQAEHLLALLRAEQAKVAAFEPERTRLTADLAAANERVAPLDAEIERLRRQLAEAASRPAAGCCAAAAPSTPSVDAEQRKRDEAALASLRAANEGLEHSKRQLEGRLAESEGKAGQAGQRERELERRLREAEERLREAGTAQEREREGWRDEKSALEARVRAAEARAATLGQENGALQKRLATCEAQLEDLTDENERLALEFDDLVTLTFKQIDTDGSMELDGPEIRRALNLLGLTSVSDLELIARHDGGRKGGDAKIQMDEFPALVREMLAKMREQGLSGLSRAATSTRTPVRPRAPTAEEREREGWRDEKSALEARLRAAEARATGKTSNNKSRACIIS